MTFALAFALAVTSEARNMDHAAALPAESVLEHETSTGLNTFKLGFWIFLGSETLFFGSLISTYMVYKHQSVLPPIRTTS